MSKTALIIGNGEPPSPELLEEFADADFLLCADGGADTAHRHGYTPDYIVGDLDSVSPQCKDRIDADRLILIDAEGHISTDIQKVLDHAVALGITTAVLLGFTGGRTDHLLWNLSMLKAFADRLFLRLVDDHCDIRLIDQQIRFRANIGQQLSLCPLNGAVEGITTSGLKWPLQNERLIPGVRDGISNEVVANSVEIQVGQGDLLLCVQQPAAGSRIAVC